MAKSEIFLFGLLFCEVHVRPVNSDIGLDTKDRLIVFDNWKLFSKVS